MAPSGDINKMLRLAELLSAADKTQIDHFGKGARSRKVTAVGGDLEYAGGPISRVEAERDRGLRGKSKVDRELCQTPSMKAASAVSLEEVLAGPSATSDLDTWSIGIDDQLLAGQTIVALRATDVERPGAIYRQRIRHFRRQARAFPVLKESNGIPEGGGM